VGSLVIVLLQIGQYLMMLRRKNGANFWTTLHIIVLDDWHT